MLVILDTTETCKDPLLNNIAFDLVSFLVSRNLITLVVPELVVRETINHCREELEKALKAVEVLKRFAPNLDESLPKIDLESCVQSYAHALYARLAELGARQPGYASLDVTALVTRALQRRKPFDSSGQRGFRDAIIWEAVLSELTRNGREAVLVTRNKNDFGADGELARDLRDDLVAHGLPEKMVSVSEGMSKCVSRHLEPRLDAIKLEEGIQKGESTQFDAVQFYESSREAILRELNDDWLRDDQVGDFRNLAIAELATLDRFETCGVWSITDEEVVIHIDYIVNGRVSFEKLQETWQAIERPLQILVNMMVVFKPKTYEVLKHEVSEFQLWPDELGSIAEREYLS